MSTAAATAKRVTTKTRIAGRLKWNCGACHHTWPAPAGQTACPHCDSDQISASIEWGGQPASAPVASADLPPELTSSVSPAGIAANDSHAAPPVKPHASSLKPASSVGERIVEITVGAITPHPDNPRKDFSEESLQELAAGFKGVGVINPLTVRRAGAGYELVAGERRWRAARIANLKTVPCRVVNITDEEAFEVMIRENLDREDLNEIEKARSYQLGLEKCGLTQEAFAKRYKKSQEHVSNTIRLLGLPPAWQERLIQRQITATHARELLAWVDVPTALEKLNKSFDPKDIPSSSEFARLVREAARDASRPMIKDWGDRGCLFKPTPAQTKQLDIRTVDVGWRKERRSFNTKLWNELNGAAKKRVREKRVKATGAETASRKDLEAAQARREFLVALWRHKYNWTAAVVAERLSAAAADGLRQTLVLQTLAVLLIDGQGGQIEEALGDAVGYKSPRHYNGGGAAQVDCCSRLSEADILRAFAEIVPALLGERLVEKWDRPFHYEWLQHVAGVLKVDLATQWTPSPEFFALYDEPELKRLADEWPAADPMPFDLTAILPAWPKGFVPQDLLWVNADGEVKRPKGISGRAPKKKAKDKR